MATRNIYVRISRRFSGYQTQLKRATFGVMIGGFLLVLIASQLSGRPDLVVGYGGRLWFTTSSVLGVLWLASEWFNPVRDPLDKAPAESWAVVVLNGMLLIAVIAWFLE